LATGFAGALAAGFALTTGLAAGLAAALGAAFLTAFAGAGFLDLEATGMETPELQIDKHTPRLNTHGIELGKGETLGIRQARWANIWCAVLAVWWRVVR
jgi:hypothetical protein